MEKSFTLVKQHHDLVAVILCFSGKLRIKESCSLQTPYNSNCCSCHKAGLLCTPHCHYEAEVNENTITLFFTDDSDEE